MPRDPSPIPISGIRYWKTISRGSNFLVDAKQYRAIDSPVQELREHLGLETPRLWPQHSVLRMAAAFILMYAIVVTFDDAMPDGITDDLMKSIEQCRPLEIPLLGKSQISIAGGRGT